MSMTADPLLGAHAEGNEIQCQHRKQPGHAMNASLCLLSALPDSILTCHVPAFSTSKELCRFCLTSTTVFILEPLLARSVAEEQHGFSAIDRTGQRDMPYVLAQLHHTLDAFPDRASFKFTQPDMAYALCPELRSGDAREPEFVFVDVGGGSTGYRTVAACPPAHGDCWSLSVKLHRGCYRLTVSGWRNPHHGILDIAFDEEMLSPPDGLDWYMEATTRPYTFPAMVFEVRTTGTHVLRGMTDRCNPGALGAKYWMCLESINIVPKDEVAPKPNRFPSLRTVRSRPRRRQACRCAAPMLVVQATVRETVSMTSRATRVVSDGLSCGKEVLRSASSLLAHKLFDSLSTVYACFPRACPRRQLHGQGSSS